MTSREQFLERRARFSTLYEACLDFQQIHGQNEGHGFEHDLLVAQYGARIASVHYNDLVADKAWVAGLLHSYDRSTFALEEARAEEARRKLSLVPEGTFNSQDIAEIEFAIFNHTGSNSPEDTPTKVCLQDADRLAGLGTMTFIRSGQAYSRRPLIQLGYTRMQRAEGSTYQEPYSCHDDILGVLEWENHPQFGLRLDESKKIAGPLFKATYEALYSMYRQLSEAGLE